MASILLIEDRRGSHELLRSTLSLAGHDVIVVPSSGTTVGRFDLALVDCQSSTVGAAVGAARRLSSRVVLYSDSPEEELRDRAKASGALGYLRPPKSPRLMADEVSKLLGR